MKSFLKEFLKRGFISAWGGPFVLAIIYYFISLFNEGITFGGKEILQGMISVYLLAFVHAGASIFNQIEEWGICKSIGVHFSVLYVAYSLCYFMNSWIPFNLKGFLIFTGIFAAIYIVVWAVVYICVRGSSRKINDKLNNI